MNNKDKATYALLADNVYWDVRKGYELDKLQNEDFTNSNWTPVTEGWTVIDEISGSGLDGKADNPELKGFTARAFENTASNEFPSSIDPTDIFQVNGYDGIVFKNKETGNYVLANRGGLQS